MRFLFASGLFFIRTPPIAPPRAGAHMNPNAIERGAAVYSGRALAMATPMWGEAAEHARSKATRCVFGRNRPQISSRCGGRCECGLESKAEWGKCFPISLTKQVRPVV